jgi:hypothetical protein
MMELHVNLSGPGVKRTEGNVTLKGFHQIVQLGHVAARAVREAIRGFQLTPHPKHVSWHVYLSWHGAQKPARKARPARLDGVRGGEQDFLDEPEEQPVRARKRAPKRKKKGHK